RVDRAPPPPPSAPCTPSSIGPPSTGCARCSGSPRPARYAWSTGSPPPGGAPVGPAATPGPRLCSWPPPGGAPPPRWWRRGAARVVAARGAVLERALGDLSANQRRTLHALLGKVMGGLVREKDGGAWTCRLCDLTACGRNEGRCPTANAAAAKYGVPAPGSSR